MTLKQDGATSLLSKHRGKPSNHRLPAEVRALALSLVRERYPDFGPTMAAEKLATQHGCSISHETLRGWMIADGLWIDRRHRLPSPHQPRRRHDCLGELVQIDGSDHAWFEDRGERCTLLAFVDDATSRLMLLRFVVSESAFDYFRATRSYLEIHGKPVALYSDKHGIFRVNNKRRSGWRGDHAVWPRAVGAEHRHHLRQQSPGEGPGRAGIRHTAGSAGEGAAAGRAIDDRHGECVAARVYRGLQYPLWPWPGECQATCIGRYLREDDLDEVLALGGRIRTVTQNLTLHYDRMMLMLDPTPSRARVGAQEGRDRLKLPGWPGSRFQFDGTALGFRGVRQDPDSRSRHHRRAQQTAVGRVGTSQDAAGRVCAESAAETCCAAARRRTTLRAPGLPSKGRALAWNLPL